MDVNSNASMPNAAQYLESLKQAYEGAVGAGGRKFIYLTPEGFKAMSRSEALLSFVQTGGKVTTVSHAMLSSIVEAASKSESSSLPEHFAQNVSRLASSSDAFSSRRAHQKFQTVFSSLTQELSTAKKPEAASTLVSPLRADGKQAAAKCAEWEVNFGLLYSAHENTDDPEMKSTIRFLMANYLAKAAFLNAEVAHDSLTVRQEYEDMAQVGQFNFGGQYHRGIDAQIPLLRMVGLEGKIGSKERGHDVIPMDSMGIQDLFRVGFVTTPGLDQRGAIVELLVAQFEAHLDSFPDNMEFPVLIDITEQIGQSLITNGDPEKIQEYQAKQKEARDQINSIVKEAADIVRKRHPDNEKVQTQAADYLKSNLAVVSRAKAGESLAVLGLHPGMFGPDDFEQKPTGKFDAPPSHLRNEFLRKHAKEWAGHTAINIGAVNFRRVAANASCDPAALSQLGGGRAVQYAVPGKVDVVMYPTLSEIVDTNAFNLLIAMAEGKGGAGSAEALLAKATVMMMARLIDKIGDAQWKQKQNDPAVRELCRLPFLEPCNTLQPQ